SLVLFDRMGEPLRQRQPSERDEILREAKADFVEHRRDVIEKRSLFELEKARERAHILAGLLIALQNLDEIIQTIRQSADAEAAKVSLMTRFKLSELQAQAILDMQLRRLAALERQKIEDEHKETLIRIKHFEELLADPKKVLALIQEDMKDFREQLRCGSIQRAYRALLGTMMKLRTHFQNRYPGYAISGLYQGYLDMTYFAIVPPVLKQRSLKIAIVFNYEAFRFEAWLSGANRQVQRKTWELFRESQWAEYRVVTPAKGVDSIVECILAEGFDPGDPDSLTASIEEKTVKFIDDIEKFFSDPGSG
ncbi:MAG: hypothetical protein HGA82_01905, partial [Anaerolineales bacterium]|nr:hypothetical protein [Anaerolineales bacterium]